MQNNPLVTIYMPTKNRLDLLTRAVDSVLNQDYTNIELIIVDDGSTDATPVYLAETSKRDSRVRYFINSQSLGACASRNKAILSANGDLITGIDDDDYFLPDRITSLYLAWEKKSADTIAIFSDSLILLPTGKSKRTFRPNVIKQRDLIDSNIVGNQIFVATKVLIDAGGFHEDMPAWQDMELWYRLLSVENAKFECLNEASYVVDTSHPHERISTGKIEKIKDAYQIFLKKHALSDVDSLVMSMQVHMYQPDKFPFKSIVAKIRRKPNLRSLKESLHAIMVYFIRIKSTNK